MPENLQTDTRSLRPLTATERRTLLKTASRGTSACAPVLRHGIGHAALLLMSWYLLAAACGTVAAAAIRLLYLAGLLGVSRFGARVAADVRCASRRKTRLRALRLSLSEGTPHLVEEIRAHAVLTVIGPETTLFVFAVGPDQLYVCAPDHLPSPWPQARFAIVRATDEPDRVLAPAPGTLLPLSCILSADAIPADAIPRPGFSRGSFDELRRHAGQAASLR